MRSLPARHRNHRFVTDEAHNSGMEKIKIEQHSFAGTLWFMAWLFTIGFLGLSFGKGVLAILLWPYYLGVHFGSLPH
jgi:hypothetical protein